MSVDAATLAEIVVDFVDKNGFAAAADFNSAPDCGIIPVQADTANSDAAIKDFFMNFPIQLSKDRKFVHGKVENNAATTMRK